MKGMIGVFKYLQRCVAAEFIAKGFDLIERR